MRVREVFFPCLWKKNTYCYKFSQDHLELFFAAIRAAGGFNNNPTSTQFIAAYKRLFVRSAIAGTNGNCEQRDATQILNFEHTSFNKKKITLSEVSLMRLYDLESVPSAGVEEIDDEEEEFLDDYFVILHCRIFSEDGKIKIGVSHLHRCTRVN